MDTLAIISHLCHPLLVFLLLRLLLLRCQLLLLGSLGFLDFLFSLLRGLGLDLLRWDGLHSN